MLIVLVVLIRLTILKTKTKNLVSEFRDSVVFMYWNTAEPIR